MAYDFSDLGLEPVKVNGFNDRLPLILTKEECVNLINGLTHLMQECKLEISMITKDNYAVISSSYVESFTRHLLSLSKLQFKLVDFIKKFD